jgi:hypothetical protein
MDELRLRARCARRGWPVTKIQHKTIAIVACKKEVKCISASTSHGVR